MTPVTNAVSYAEICKMKVLQWRPNFLTWLVIGAAVCVVVDIAGLFVGAMFTMIFYPMLIAARSGSQPLYWGTVAGLFHGVALVLCATVPSLMTRKLADLGFASEVLIFVPVFATAGFVSSLPVYLIRYWYDRR